eukprot:12962258-Ditylum_brightwellii.AAC.1
MRAFDVLHDYLQQRGLKPKYIKLDNEASAALVHNMKNKKIDVQLAPSHMHRSNAAERAIQTFRDHFIAGLASTDPKFPPQLWCCLLPQATLTLNLLQPLHINPQLSTKAQLNGVFDFNQTPLVLPDTRVSVHKKTKLRKT